VSPQYWPGSCVLLGGGNHAKVVIEAMEAAGIPKPVAVLDADDSRWGQTLHGVLIVGNDKCLGQLAARGVSCFVVGVGSSGDTQLRQALFELGKTHGLVPVTIQHPAAIVSPSAVTGCGAQVLGGAILNTDCVIGANVIVNTAAIVEHDCVIGDHVHLATGARLAGGVIVRAGAHVGIGATVKQGIEIGPRAVVGAGAVVIRDVAPGAVVAGVPARELGRDAA